MMLVLKIIHAAQFNGRRAACRRYLQHHEIKLSILKFKVKSHLNVFYFWLIQQWAQLARGVNPLAGSRERRGAILQSGSSSGRLRRQQLLVAAQQRLVRGVNHLARGIVLCRRVTASCRASRGVITF